MEIFDDIFAGWSFEINNEVTRSGFVELLTVLNTSGVLDINILTINTTSEPFHSIDQAADLCIECLEKRKVLVLSGKTILQTEYGKETVDEAIVFTLEPHLSLISIDTYTDAWMPIGYLNETLQIDSGNINSNSLQTVLKRISKMNFVKKTTPSDNEYFHDYMVHQKGFSLFYDREIKSISGIKEEDYQRVTPFLL